MNDIAAREQTASQEFVTLSQRALTQAIFLKKENETRENLSLRVYLDGKGCDGFYYGVTFDQKHADDIGMEMGAGHEKIEVVIDEKTLPFVKGSTIDWVDDERGQGFLVENPQHKKFRGKFFKRKNWEERLL